MSKVAKRKHLPERTCIACRQKRAKWEMVRIVRTPEGIIEIDLRGKKAGRGAYLCRQQECWEAGLKKKLGHALKCEIKDEQSAELVTFGKSLNGVLQGAEM